MGSATLLATIGALLIYVGCSPSVEAPEQAGAPQIVELYSWWNAPGEAEALEGLMALHQERYPESRLFNSAVDIASDAKQGLHRRLARKDVPDFFQSYVSEIRALATKNPEGLHSLNEMFSELGLNEVVYPELLRDLRVDDKIVAMPVNIHRQNTLFYNIEVFKQAGLSVPATMDELWKVCEALKAQGIIPIATSHQGWITGIFFRSIAMGELGAEEYYRFLVGKTSVAESGIIRAVHAFRRMLTNYINTNAGEVGFGWTQAASAVYHGDAAMMFHGDWAKGYFESLGWRAGVDFGAMGAPGAQELFLYGADVLALPAGAGNLGAAKAFLRTAASRDGQAIFNRFKGSSPMRRDVNLGHLDSVAAQTFRDLVGARYRVLSTSPRPWDVALGQFAHDRDVAKLVAVFEAYPVGSSQ